MSDGDVRFGSLADLWTHSSLMSAFQTKADINLTTKNTEMSVGL